MVNYLPHRSGFFKIGLLLLLLIFPLLGDISVSQAEGQTMYVNTPSRNVLQMRDKPNTSGKVVASFAYGASVNVLSKSGTWYKVQAAGYKGYMYGPYLSTKKPSGSSSSSSSSSGKSTTARTAVVNVPSRKPLNLREQPSESSRSLGRYLNGVRVSVYQKVGNWYRVSVLGTSGYMYADYLSFNGTTTSSTPSSTGSSTGPNTVVNDSGSIVYMRKTPGTDGEILKRIPVGTVVQVLSRSKYWSKVSYLSIIGYIDNSYLK